MERRTMSSRTASWDRGGKEMHVAQKDAAFRPLVETLAEKPLALDGLCELEATLTEAAFDILGAARWLRTHNDSFARAAVASALTELNTVADRLGVSR